jgi:hypothetical protein
MAEDGLQGLSDAERAGMDLRNQRWPHSCQPTAEMLDDPLADGQPLPIQCPITGANSFPSPQKKNKSTTLIQWCVCLLLVTTMADLRGRVVLTMLHTMFWRISTNGIACQDPLTLTVCKLSAREHLLVGALHLATRIVSRPHLATRIVSRPHLALNLEQTATTPIAAMNLKQAAIAARLVTKPVPSSQQAGETEIVSPRGQELSAILVILIPLSQMIQQSSGSSRCFGSKS